MKKTLLSIFAIATLGTSLNAQNVNIPDANFKNWLLNNTNLNTNGDSEVQLSEANSYSLAINVGSLNISDLTGIEEFINAVQLNCSGNQLTSLDVSNNPNLNLLNCSNNNLSSLDMRNVSTSTLSNSSFFNATGNSNLTCISVDNVADAQSTWTNLDSQTSFSTNCPPPCIVTIPDANFKAYLVGNTAINTNGDTEIQCSEASAYSGVIDCGSSNISDLTGIEVFTALIQLDCANNLLTTLNISQNTELTFLECNNNSLTALDLSQNPEITGIFCYNNLLTTLNLNQNMPLTLLNCQTNQLTSLDVSGFASLTGLYCESNQLTDLNVANGNNINMVASLDPGLIAVNNPNLTCIQIDAGYTPNSTDWHVDAIASFSTDCSGATGINEINSQNISIYPNPVENKLFIEIEEQITEMVIIDYSGKVVQSIANSNTNSIDVSGLTQGVYILKISTKEGVFTNRFIKQ